MFCSPYILLRSPLTQKFPVCQSAWSEIPVPLSRHRRLCRAHPNPNLFLYDIKRTICRTRTDADVRTPAAECRRRFVRGPGRARRAAFGVFLLVAVLEVKCIERKSEEGGKGNGEGRTKERVHSFLPRGMAPF